MSRFECYAGEVWISIDGKGAYSTIVVGADSIKAFNDRMNKEFERAIVKATKHPEERREDDNKV